MKVRVMVTEEDIERGKIDCGECPIALALSRAVPGCTPYVNGFLVGINGEHGLFARLPRVATDFIRDFDGDDYCGPIAFSLELPS